MEREGSRNELRVTQAGNNLTWQTHWFSSTQECVQERKGEEEEIETLELTFH